MSEMEVRGRCPLCGIAMKGYGRNLVCDYKRYNFPFHFYYCHRHGIYVWRGRRHELFDLNKRMNQVTSMESLEEEVLKRYEESGHMPTLSDYRIVKMRCPYCGEEWKQHDGFLVGNKKTVWCPFCSAEIPKEKAVLD